MSYVLPDPEYVPQAHYEELHRLKIPGWQHAILLGRYDGTPRAAAHEYPEPWLEGIGQILGQTVNCLTAEAQLARHGGYAGRIADEHRRDIALLCRHLGLQPPSGYRQLVQERKAAADDREGTDGDS